MFSSKKIGIFGLGLSGIAALKFFAIKGYRFVAYDDNVETVKKLQELYPELLYFFKDLKNNAWNELDCLILAPGIPLDYPKPHLVVEKARKAGAEIICDIEVFYRYFSKNFFIGITGTNGKSTTSALVDHILRHNFLDVVLGGNIGFPVLDIKAFDEKTIFVFEVSSYQLDLLKSTKFNIACITNITPDHIERHGNFENYKKTKYKIFNNQTAKDSAIINQDLEPVSNSLTFSEKNAKADVLIIDGILHYKDNMYILPENKSLVGEHNQQNLSAAFAICLKVGLSIEHIINALPSFVGLKHRMQYLGEIAGITYINDSKATNADSTSYALNSFRNIIWIVGGVAKDGGIESLRSSFSRVKHALLIGKSQDDFANTIGNEIPLTKCNNLENAFIEANKMAKAGDVVLLSPACASFDQWKNFEERGDAFIKLVDELLRNY
jgi:UDP-N-acetylmuramoylalanine--D-glutamate ligase